MRIAHTFFAILVVRIGICGGRFCAKGGSNQNPTPTQQGGAQGTQAQATLATKGQVGKQATPVTQQTPVKTNGEVPKKLPQANGQQTSTPASKQTEHKEEVSTQANAVTHKSQQLVVTTDPNTLDLATPNTSFCRSFDVNINGVPAKVYVMTSGITVTKVKHGDKIVWSAGDGESCFYCAIPLKENVPTMALIRIKGQKLSQLLIENDGSKWQLSYDNVQDKVNKLRTVQGNITNFSLDISLDNSNEDCTVGIFEGDDLKTRIYTPKAGKAIGKITDGSTTIGELNKSYTCYLCEYYSKGGVTLLRVHTQKNYNLAMSSYNKDASGWKSISGKELSDELVKMSK